ncbi:helix-turn-helix domain-containing protein [Bradyrhizobium liaoningense]|uniref:helix-turn-helix domain-containing protein n=1 Tax=Bradyrhizobium liaoningense TaxID=43992 RepID=UPI001BA73F64|nr:AraC family transcriptional regulator [Bradyrhizobium liaoningense]MBR0983415.1 helix-turn-helix transcriptional regulator [Bradyrhizobium liaoningense]
MTLPHRQGPRGPQFFAASESLGEIVEAFCDVDLADAATACARTIKVLPTTSPVLIVHYRSPMASQRGVYKGTVNGMHTRAAALKPSGPVGVVLVRLKPEAADRVLGVRPADLLDASVEISDIFGDNVAAWLEKRLAGAGSAAARVTCMQGFLEQRRRPSRLDPLVARAMRAIRRNPAISMRGLADCLDIGERSLQRRFKTETGASAKRFARIERMLQAIAARRSGADWADAAHACGFTDQAHLIRDFRTFAGSSPEVFCRRVAPDGVQGWNDELASSDFYNTFVS